MICFLPMCSPLPACVRAADYNGYTTPYGPYPVIKRHIGDSNTQDKEDSLEAAKNGIYVLIAAAVIMWLAPVLLIDVTNPLGDTPSNSNSTLVGSIVSFKNDAQTVAAAILDIMKYVLLVGAVAGIAVLRVGPSHLKPG